MPKITPLATITSGYASTQQLNANFATIVNAFQNTFSLDGSTPNTLNCDLDMNQFAILNAFIPNFNDSGFTLYNGTLGSMAGQNSSSVNITGGTIDNTLIGSITPRNGIFTNITINGNITNNVGFSNSDNVYSSQYVSSGLIDVCSWMPLIPITGSIKGMYYTGPDSSSNPQTYAVSTIGISSNIAGAINGDFTWGTVYNNVFSNKFGLGNGLYTSGLQDMGYGTINSTGFFVNGIQVANTPTNAASLTNLKITSDASNPNTTVNITATGIAVNPVITNSGTNGLDTGSASVSTWYYLYIIVNGSTYAGLYSLSSTAPTLPSGYAIVARVGARYTDSSAHLLRVIQYGNRARYVIGTLPATLPVIASGTQSGWASKSTATVCPPTASSINITTSITNGTGGEVFIAPNSSYNASFGNLSAPIGMAVPGSSEAATTNTDIVFETAQTIYYQTSAAPTSVAAYCAGWTDNL